MPVGVTVAGASVSEIKMIDPALNTSVGDDLVAAHLRYDKATNGTEVTDDAHRHWPQSKR